MSKAKNCDVCGHGTPYTDWTRCELCSRVLRIAGHEKTLEEKADRVAWERRMCAKLGLEGHHLAAVGHARAADAYARLISGEQS